MKVKPLHPIFLAVSYFSLVVSSTLTAFTFSPVVSAQTSDVTAQYFERALFSVGDIANLSVKNVDELSGDYVVDDEGYIDFPLIGLVQVEGLNAEGLAAKLVTLYSVDYLNNPTIVVSMIPSGFEIQLELAPTTPEAESLIPEPAPSSDDAGTQVIAQQPAVTNPTPSAQPVQPSTQNDELQSSDPINRGYIVLHGAVEKPAIYEALNLQTFSAFIKQSGGLLRNADQNEIIVSRAQSETERTIYAVNYRDILSRKIPDPLLYPSDIILVKSKTDRFSLEEVYAIMDPLAEQITQAK